jgi:hypothetical protein
MKKIIFISDFFVEQHLGGAEINDDTLIKELISNGFEVEKINSNRITKDIITNNLDCLFVISNFASLDMRLSPYFALSDYCFYEHDYKFLSNRTPISYPNFIAPKEKIINYNFYRNAKAIICLCDMHAKIFKDNLGFDNITNINCSMFDDKKIDLLLELGKTTKLKKNAVVRTDNLNKKMNEIIKWCNARNVEYELISDPDNNSFLEKLSKFENLIFMTGHPEPTPRIAVECKLMGVKMVSNKKLIGVANEYWWNLKPEEVAIELRKIRQDAVKIFKELCSE